jgi:hypothetical protein
MSAARSDWTLIARALTVAGAAVITSEAMKAHWYKWASRGTRES